MTLTGRRKELARQRGQLSATGEFFAVTFARLPRQLIMVHIK